MIQNTDKTISLSCDFSYNFASFSLGAEYFIAVSTLYITVVMIVLTRQVWCLNLQKFLSEYISLILIMACCLIINDNVSLSHEITLNNSIINDSIGYWSKLTICFFASIFFLIIADTLNGQKLVSFEYLLLLLLAVEGLLILCSSNDLLTSYLAIELASFSSYILSGFRKDSIHSAEAGLKYFIVGSISSAFLLFGISFIYACSGSIVFSDLADLFCTKIIYLPYYSEYLAHYDKILVQYQGVAIDDAEAFNNITSKSAQALFQQVSWAHTYGIHWQVVIINQILAEANDQTKYVYPVIAYLNDFEKNSFGLVIVGIIAIIFSVFIKLALAPFHTWSLDVYEGSPTNSTFFFAVLTKLSFFIFLIRFCYVSMLSFHEEWQFYSTWVALFSAFVGSFGGLRQRKLKTLLAYSSTSHMGYALLALSCVSLIGIQVLFFYLIVYMIASVNIWYINILLRVKNPVYKSKFSKELGDFSLLHKSNPALAFSLAITMFSIAGLPPLVGFLAKFGVFLVLVKEKFYFVSAIAVFCSVVSTFYYIKIIKILYFENVLVGKLYYPIKTNKVWFISIFTFILLFLFINPNLLFLLIYKIVFDSFV
jgi:NADH:ubiquinone oxidoreductase subunit 2 (subunit N)